VVVNALAKGVEKIKETPRVPAERLSFISVLIGMQIFILYASRFRIRRLSPKH
jgi:hypothetical protein